MPGDKEDHDLLIRVDAHVSNLIERIDRLEKQVGHLQKTVSEQDHERSNNKGFKAGVVFAVGLVSSFITGGISYLITK